MSDRRTAIGLFFVGPPPAPPASFDGERVLWSRAWRHDAVSVLVLACYVHPLADRLDSLGPALDDAAHASGAKLAIVDPLFNEAVVPGRPPLGGEQGGRAVRATCAAISRAVVFGSFEVASASSGVTL